MTKRSVALVGVLIVMAMIGSSVIGAVSAIAASDTANGSFSVFLPLILNAIGAMAEVPQGAVMTFNLASCPSGWTEVTDAQGRAIVGLPSGGTLSGEVGSGLSDLEDRTHTHIVDPNTTITSISGAHTHIVDPPDTVSESGGNHAHSLNGLETEGEEHSHQWATFFLGDWMTGNAGGEWVTITNWSNGMDAAGDGYYPLSRNNLEPEPYFTSEDSHNHQLSGNTDSHSGHTHSVLLPPFTSDEGGNHSHSVDIPSTSSTTSSTSDVMPYIQFLVCEKD